MKRRTNLKNEKGAIIIEAIIALTVYIFTIFTILSIVDVCYTQARISIALNSAARDLSKYSYFYYKFNADDAQQEIEGAAGDSREMTENIINGTGEFMSAFYEVGESQSLSELQSNFESLENEGQGLSDSVNAMADSFADDPKGFMVGMGMMTLNNLAEGGKGAIAQAMAKAFMKKNLVAFEGDDPDAFLRRHHVVDGLDGLDFTGSSFMVGGESDQIILTLRYEIEVLKLLDVEHTFTIRQTAKTDAWGNGVSNVAE